MQERLDRVVENQKWWEMFLDYAVINLVCSESEDCPILTDTEESKTRQGKRHQQKWKFFEVMWVKEEERARIIDEHWHEGGSTSLRGKLEVVQQKLFKWCRRKISGNTHTDSKGY